MDARTQKTRLGVFIFISGLLLCSLILFFAANKLFKKTDTYFVSYHNVSVSGLEVGSSVNYLGINIGSISKIFIDPKDINIVIVELALQQGTPIKVDDYADIVSMGITGLKSIQIRGGTNQAENLKEGKYIKAGSSATEEITGKANIIAEKAEKVLNNLQLFTVPENMNKFSEAAGNINRLAEQINTTINRIDTLIKENKTAINETIQSADLAVSNFKQSSQTLKLAINNINNLIQSDTIRQIAGDAHDILQQLKETDLKLFIHNLADVTDQTRKLLYKLDQNLDMDSRELTESIRLLRITLSNLEKTSNLINTDPSILIRGIREKNIPDRKVER